MLLWRATKKKSVDCRSKEQRRAFSELSFELALALWLQYMILQNTISRFNFFRIESFDSWVCYFGEPWNKTKIRVIFRIGFDVITMMILYVSILPQKGTGKKCRMLQQLIEEHFDNVLSSLCMLISVCAFKLVDAFSWLVALVAHNVSLASLVPFSSHYYINNSPLSSTYGDMTTILTVCRVLPLTVNGSPHEQVAKRGTSNLPGYIN